MELSKSQLSAAAAILLGSGGGVGAVLEYMVTQKTMQIEITECADENTKQEAAIEKLKEKVMEHDILLGVHHP